MSNGAPKAFSLGGSILGEVRGMLGERNIEDPLVLNEGFQEVIKTINPLVQRGLNGEYQEPAPGASEEEKKKYEILHPLQRFFGSLFSVLGPMYKEMKEREEEERVKKETQQALVSLDCVESLVLLLEERPDLAEEAFKLHAKNLNVAWFRVIAKYEEILPLLEERIDGTYNLPMLAATKGHLDVVRYLLDEVPDFEIDKMYGPDVAMIHAACREGQIEVVKELLERGSNPSLCFASGVMPSRHAVYGNHIPIINRLYLAGASFEGCFTGSGVEPETVVHLLDLDILHEEDLLKIAFVEKSFFLRIYTLLYSLEENGKKRAYRFLEGTLTALQNCVISSGQQRGKDGRDSIVTHFSMLCVTTRDIEERELLVEILRPYIDASYSMTLPGDKNLVTAVVTMRDD